MGTREHSIRGGVRDAWEMQGKKHWSIPRTVDVCIAIDRELEATAYGPAPRSRKAREQDNQRYFIQPI